MPSIQEGFHFETVERNLIYVDRNRQRQEFDEAKLQELADDIKKRGLLQPLVLNKVTDTQYRLVAGERRLRATALLGMNDLPSYVTKFDSELSHREAELAENICRAELTWQERTAAIGELHRLRKLAAEERGETQTITKTTQELSGEEKPAGRLRDAVSRSTVLFDSGAMQLPEIAQAKSEAEAWKIFTKQQERIHADAIRDMMPPSEHKLINAKFQDVVDDLPDNHFACCVVDPPYGIGVEGFGDAAKNKHAYDEEDVVQLHEDLIKVLTRVMQVEAHVYLFCDIDYFPEWSTLFEEQGWKVRRVPLIWYKGTMGHLTDGIPSGFRRSYECILVASRGKKPFQGLSTDVLLNHTAERDRDHGAQKPVGLYSQLLALSTLPGDAVIDLCAGTGPIVAAASRAQLRATAIEMNPDTFKLMQRREVM